MLCSLNHKCWFDRLPWAFYYAFLNFILGILPAFKSIEFLLILCNLLLHVSSGHIINLGEWNHSRQQHEIQSSCPLLFNCLRCIYGSCFVPEDNERSGVCESKLTIFLWHHWYLALAFSNYWYTNVIPILETAPLDTHSWIGYWYGYWFYFYLVSDWNCAKQIDASCQSLKLKGHFK